MNDLESKYEEFISLYYELKQKIKAADPYQFERWKAGGFLIDDDIVSMYPHLGKVIEDLSEG